MAPRYRTSDGNVSMRVPKRGLLRRGSKTVQCDLIDLSIDGALVALPSGTSVDQGVRLDLTIDGHPATVGVRHGEVDANNRLQCGLAFRETTASFDAAVNKTIAAAITDPRRHETWRIS